MHKFLLGWDKVLRKGFETILNCRLDDKWWAVARMNSKFGGMGLRSGIQTSSAQHLTSLVKNAEGIRRYLPDWDLNERTKLVENGVGAAAEACEMKKVEKYSGKIDERTGIPLPFIMETQGGIGGQAKKFMIEIEKKKKQRANELRKIGKSVANLDFMTSLSI